MLARARRARPSSRATGTTHISEGAISSYQPTTTDVPGDAEADDKDSVISVDDEEMLEFEQCAMRTIVPPIPKVKRSHNLTKVEYGNRPHGLKKKISLADYRARPVCTLSGYNYKVNAMIGVGKRDAKHLLSVLDSGAGPSLIRRSCCPELALEKMMQEREVVNLRSATNHALDGLGIVNLSVTVGSQTVKTPFVVVENLGADVLLGCTYIDYHVKAIVPDERRVHLKNGDSVPIIRRQALKPVTRELPEGKFVGRRSTNNFNAIRVSRRTTIPPQSEKMVRGSSRDGRTYGIGRGSLPLAAWLTRIQRSPFRFRLPTSQITR